MRVRLGTIFLVFSILFLVPSSLFPNSLWNNSNNSKFKYLISDKRGASVGDIVTITVYENSLTSSSKFIPIRNNPEPENTERKSSNETKVVLQIAAIVKEVYDNGTILLEGKKNIKVEDQDLQIMIRGIARIEDINRDNTIDSTKLAEANIIYNGKIIFQQIPGQDRWFEWILSALAGVLF